MKILIIKLGMHYTPCPETKHAAIGEVDSIINLCNKAKHHVSIITDQSYEKYSYCLNINDIPEYHSFDDFDLCIVLNGLVNQLDKYNLLQYNVIQHINCPVLFFLCDLELHLVQHTLHRKDIICVTQARELDILKNDIEDRKELYHFKDYYHFDFQKFPIINNGKFFDINQNPKYDIVYGGGFREGRRAEKMLKYLFDLPFLNIAIAGNINKSHFNYDSKYFPTFLNSIDYNKFCDFLTESYCTLYIADKSYVRYESTSQRLYETVIAGSIPIIDELSDPTFNCFNNNKLLSLFLHVNNVNDYCYKINQIKHDYKFRNELIDLCRENILEGMTIERFSDTYINNFDSMLYYF